MKLKIIPLLIVVFAFQENPVNISGRFPPQADLVAEEALSKERISRELHLKRKQIDMFGLQI